MILESLYNVPMRRRELCVELMLDATIEAPLCTCVTPYFADG